jgi:cytochrome c oxidase assembly protein subunit 15
MEVRRLFRGLVFAATALTLFVVVVGAYVRLSDAGLGCPDWPGCYGQITPHHAREAIDRAVAEQGGAHGPVSMPKAWKEMFHRYVAGVLGLLLLAVAAVALLRQRELGQSAFLPLSVLGLVLFQATLGMWTVTMLLKPVIVTLHLLGGMAIFGLLVWLCARQLRIAAPPDPRAARRLRPWAALALLVAAGQIALGGWVSANYAALACVDFPTCHGAWVPEMDFRHGFQLVRELGMTAAGTHLAYEALTAIHWTHRAGAAVIALVAGGLAVAALRAPGLARWGALLLGVLLAQIALGVANVLGGLPLPVAVAHNAGAALLLAVLVMLNFVLSLKPAG